MSEALPLASGVGAAAVVERLAARQQQLAAEREQRQAQLQADSDTREDVNGFLGSYKADYAQLQQRAGDLQGKASTTQQDGAAKAALLEQLEALSVDITDKEHAVSAASYFLPPYELRSCSSQLQQLRLHLADIKQQLQPKRKFAFSKAVARTNISTTAAAAAASTAQQQQLLQDGASAGTPAASCTTASTADTSAQAAPAGAESTAAAAAGQSSTGIVSPALSPQDQQLIAAGHGFAGQSAQLLVPSAQQLAGQGFVLHDLTDCDVFLLGRLSALRLQHCRNCRVYTGPVIGATFVDSCSGCTFMLASYQVRIHSAEGCRFYLRLRSRPIIEHSSNLTFAPYAAETLLSRQPRTTSAAAAVSADDDPQRQRQQQQQQRVTVPSEWQPAQVLAEAQLLEEAGLWQQVDDFGWVKASASPHWRVLPEEDRQAVPQQLPQQQQQQQHHHHQQQQQQQQQ